MLYRIFNLFILLFFSLVMHGQLAITFDLSTDLEFSMAGEKSHYYYNEIDQDRKDPRVGISNLNLIAKLQFNKLWSLHTRVLIQRDKGQKLKKTVFPLLNLQWLSKKRKYGITVGSFINPFGSFNKKQLAANRNFVGLPLAYAYYVNISDKIGFAEHLGDIAKIKIDKEVQWGTSMLYYGGYTTGAMFSWNIKPGKINWKIALTTGASNMRNPLALPFHYGIVSHIKLRPKYFWEQGFSISHGSFLLNSEVSNQLDDINSYTQTVIGTDYKFGYKYFELSGEIMAASYQVPQYSEPDHSFSLGINRLNCFSTYLDLKYELSFLQGSYLAYRIDYLDFGTSRVSEKWDNLVLRHSIAMGYYIHKNVLARLAVSTQHVDSKKWDKAQQTLRFVLTAHL